MMLIHIMIMVFHCIIFADRTADEYLWKKIPAGAKAVPSEGFGRYAHEIWVITI